MSFSNASSQVGTFSTSKIPIVRSKGIEAGWLLVLDGLSHHPAYIDLGPVSIHFCDLPREAEVRSLLLVCIAEPGSVVASEGSFILAP